MTVATADALPPADGRRSPLDLTEGQRRGNRLVDDIQHGQPGHFAGDAAGILEGSQSIDEAELECLSPGHDAPVGEFPDLALGDIAFVADDLDELVVDVDDHCLEQVAVPVGHVAEGRTDVLVLA